MKITKINLNDFQQFKGLDIDLTYPKGHEKEGQPLDKVCFIGQSGTGKTTILNILNELVTLRKGIATRKVNTKDTQYFIEFLLNKVKNQSGKVLAEVHATLPFFQFEEEPVQTTKGYDEFILNWRTILINYPAEFNERVSDFLEKSPIHNPLSFLKSNVDINDDIHVERVKLENKMIYDFKKDNPLDIWKSILMDARDYMVSELSFSQKLTKALIKNKRRANELIEEFTKWQTDNPSPFIGLANVVNPVIEKFYCKIKTDFDFEKAEDLGFVKIETTNDKDIPFNLWSSGTKRVVLTAMPLHYLETKNTIVTIDEPEGSLYPDVQGEIVDFYSSLAPDAQFFYATHSPIIASSFKPWEIVELKFDYKKGKVFQEKYYEGERHIDNYKIFPEYLRWDSILTRVFDLEMEGNEKRKEKLLELSQMEADIKSEPDKTKKRKMYDEFKNLADKLDWQI